MKEPEPATLVLFDIDGTLVDARGAGKEAFSRTLRQVFGIEDDLHYVHFAGATDLNVFTEVLANHGLKATRTRARTFFAHLPAELRAALGQRVAVALPGTRPLLQTLYAHPGVLTGLVTGNEEQCAWIKLRHCGLEVPFDVGAYGLEHGRREELARRALQRARRAAGRARPIEHLFLVGDSPADIAAARAIGAEPVAVTTGLFDRRSLEQAGAGHVLDHLEDTASMLELLGIDPHELPEMPLAHTSSACYTVGNEPQARDRTDGPSRNG